MVGKILFTKSYLQNILQKNSYRHITSGGSASLVESGRPDVDAGPSGREGCDDRVDVSLPVSIVERRSSKRQDRLVRSCQEENVTHASSTNHKPDVIHAYSRANEESSCRANGTVVTQPIICEGLSSAEDRSTNERTRPVRVRHSPDRLKVTMASGKSYI